MTTRSQGASEALQEDAELVALLCAGDEDAFRTLVRRYGSAMLRTARLYVRDEQVAEEIVQETWVAVLRSIDGFEGRSSLRAWLFTVLGNCARRRGRLEARSRPFSAVGTGESEPAAVLPANHARWARCWSTINVRWDELPEPMLLSGELRETIAAAVRALPPAQCAVLTLHDLEGWSSVEVAQVLGLTPGNQRVLLHRARLSLRMAIEGALER